MDEDQKPPPCDGEFLYKKVISKLEKDPESRAKITAHAMAVTGCPALPAANASFEDRDQERKDLWGDCFTALVLHAKGNADAFADLKGQHAVELVKQEFVPPVPVPPEKVVPPKVKAESEEDLARMEPVELGETTEPVPEPVPVPVPEPEPVPVAAKPALDPLARALLEVLAPHLAQASLDTDAVNAIAKTVMEKEMTDLSLKLSAKVDEYLANVPPRDVVEVRHYDGRPPHEIGRQHYKFALLLAAINQRLNVLMVGPAASGKSTTAHEVSKALGLAFDCMSVGQQTSKSDLFGYRDANGIYQDTALVRLGRDGGVMLLDEMDAGNAGVMTQANMILANGHFPIPSGMITKHKDFVLMAAANTYGLGANRVYVGRNQLDGATMDRFVVIDWDYDEGLEASLVGVEMKSPKLNLGAGGLCNNDEWINFVHRVRRATEKQQAKFIVSPRATFHGIKLFQAGVGRKHVEEMVLWRGLEKATRDKIRSEAGGD